MGSLKPSVLVLLSFAVLIVMSQTGLAQEQTPSLDLESPPDQIISWETVQQCWLSLEEIVGCYSEVYRSFVNGQVGFNIGPSCCLAINDITSNCWLGMFPNNPSFPPLLKNYCKIYEVGQVDAPAPTPFMEPADS
ncbi:egg cell-secreted protein 1.4-like [Rutidosis leptorrhynchoides]|uniref:egg cell-secreted protein 1.4-like n=1 Tax=Rutidosis leptorrhynchoides TaxID=125765 RepID=UPI003A9951D1